MATDQEIRDAGFKYIPQQKYLLNPFQIPTTDDDDGGGGGGGGIPFTNAGDGFNPYNTNMSNIRQDYNAFPSRQAGEIYSKTFNPQSFDPSGQIKNAQFMYNKAASDLANPFNRLAETETFTGMRPSKEVMDYYGEKILDNQERYRTQGQYVDPYDPNYSSMTEAQKFMDNYPDYYGVPSGVPEKGIPGLIKGYLKNSLIGKGFGMAKDFLGRALPINERAIMENEARGAGIFTDDIGRIVTDDYNTAGGIMAGYNLNKIDADSFGKRRGTIENTLGSKYNLSASQIEAAKNDPNYTGPGKDLIERLGLLDESEEDILGAKKKTTQIYKMRKDKKTKDKQKTKDDTTGTDTTGTDTPTGGQYTGTPGGNTGDPGGNFANIDNSGKNYGPYSNNSSSSGSGGYSSKGGGASYSSGGGGASYSSSASTGAKDGFGYGLADGGRAKYFFGGRVNFKNGGLASIL